MSRKMRSTLRLKSKQGYAIGTPPMGYAHDPAEPKHWIVDEEGAAVIRRIYAMRLNGTSITEIAQLLKRDKILIPSVYAVRKGLRKTAPQRLRGEYLWDPSMVQKILTNPLYVGDVVNFRTYSKSYKLKTRYDNPAENWEISQGVHEPVIPREQWEAVQKTFQGTKMRAPKQKQKSIFAGFLKCSDCGANLNYKKAKKRTPTRSYAPYWDSLWCKRWDSNPHGDNHTHLKRACLPIPTLLQLMLLYYSDSNCICQQFFPLRYADFSPFSSKNDPAVSFRRVAFLSALFH